ncbi:MAG: hypothetical protein GY723_09515 [bacterium]|nr:hypothetical protein [bacterium]MCP5067991.1 hypothetical protein [bacterium]
MLIPPIPSDLHAALERGSAATADLFSSPTLGGLGRVRSCRLASFPDQGLVPGDDMTASLVLSVLAPTPATAVLSFEPETALHLIRCAADDAEGEPLERFASLSRAMAERILAELFGESASLGPVHLEEDGVVPTVLGTHAPPDTALLCAELVLADEDSAVGGVFYLLTDGKQPGAAPC